MGVIICYEKMWARGINSMLIEVLWLEMEKNDFISLFHSYDKCFRWYFTLMRSVFGEQQHKSAEMYNFSNWKQPLDHTKTHFKTPAGIVWGKSSEDLTIQSSIYECQELIQNICSFTIPGSALNKIFAALQCLHKCAVSVPAVPLELISPQVQDGNVPTRVPFLQD